MPNLWRPGSVKIKRYYTRNGRLSDPHGEERKGNKTTVKLKQVQYIGPLGINRRDEQN